MTRIEERQKQLLEYEQLLQATHLPKILNEFVSHANKGLFDTATNRTNHDPIYLQAAETVHRLSHCWPKFYTGNETGAGKTFHPVAQTFCASREPGYLVLWALGQVESTYAPILQIAVNSLGVKKPQLLITRRSSQAPLDPLPYQTQDVIGFCLPPEAIKSDLDAWALISLVTNTSADLTPPQHFQANTLADLIAQVLPGTQLQHLT